MNNLLIIIAVCAISLSGVAQTKTNAPAVTPPPAPATNAVKKVVAPVDPLAGIYGVIAIKSNSIVQLRAKSNALGDADEAARRRENQLAAAGQWSRQLERDAVARRANTSQKRAELARQIAAAELAISDLRRAYKIPEPKSNRPPGYGNR